MAFTGKIGQLPERLAVGNTGDAPRILFFDLATQFGFAFGVPGQMPISGSRYFTQTGRKPRDGVAPLNARTYANVQRFMDLFMEEWEPTHVGWEAPAAAHSMAGKTNAQTMELLHGIPANVAGTIYRYGVHEFVTPLVGQIRKHFLGKNPKDGKVAKKLVFQRCRDIGWIEPLNEPDITYDRTDALAGWSFAEHYYSPKLATHVDDLSVSARRREKGLML